MKAMDLNFTIIIIQVAIYLLSVHIIVNTNRGATLKSNRTFKCEIMKDNDGSIAAKDHLWIVVTSSDKRMFRYDGPKLVHSISLPITEITDKRIESEFSKLKEEIYQSIKKYGKAI